MCIRDREFSVEYAPALTLLYRNSLKQEALPQDWLHASIDPVYKGGNKDRSSAENYRPVSLTSICCKIMVHIIYSNIMNHPQTNKILSDVQHGFRNKRSCESQLLLTTNDFCQFVWTTILLDFSKAFDKVNHHKICAKLHHYGIRGYCLNWIQSFRNKSYSMGALHKKQMCCQRCPKERCWAHFPFWFILTICLP